MDAAEYNFKIDQGATKNFTIIYKDSNGNTIPLNTYSGALNVKRKQDVESSTYTVSLTTANGGLTLGADGTINVLFLPSQTGLLEYPEYIYELILNRSVTDVQKLIYGKINVRKEI